MTRFLISLLLVGLGTSAWAGGTIEFGENRSISVGAGMRAAFTSGEYAAPSGDDDSSTSADHGLLFDDFAPDDRQLEESSRCDFDCKLIHVRLSCGARRRSGQSGWGHDRLCAAPLFRIFGVKSTGYTRS